MTSASAFGCVGLRCGQFLNGRRGFEAVSSSGRFAEGQWSGMVMKTPSPRHERRIVIRADFGPRADSAWYTGQDFAAGFGVTERSDRLLSPCAATPTAKSDGLAVPGHWGLSDGVSKELVMDEEIGVVYSNEPPGAAAGHSGSAETAKSLERGHKLATGETGSSSEVQDHTLGKTADGYRVLDEDLAGDKGGIHDDGRKFSGAGSVPPIVRTGKPRNRLAPASLSQSMQAVSGRGLKAVVGVAAPLVNPSVKGPLSPGGAGMMAATLTVASVVGAVSQGANLLQQQQKGGSPAGATKVCRVCKGAGRVACDLCQGTGQIRWEGKYRHNDECPSCEGRGEAKCRCEATLKLLDLASKK